MPKSIWKAKTSQAPRPECAHICPPAYKKSCQEGKYTAFAERVDDKFRKASSGVRKCFRECDVARVQSPPPPEFLTERGYCNLCKWCEKSFFVRMKTLRFPTE